RRYSRRARSSSVAARVTSCASASSASCWRNAYAFCVKPRDAASNNPLCRGVSASRLSISLRLKGAAERISSGSSSAANAVPPSARASPIRLSASCRTEQPPSATSTLSARPRVKLKLACMVVSSVRNEGGHRAEMRLDLARGGEPRHLAVGQAVPAAKVPRDPARSAQPHRRHRRKQVMLDMVVQPAEQEVVQPRGAEVARYRELLLEKRDRLLRLDHARADVIEQEDGAEVRTDQQRHQRVIDERGAEAERQRRRHEPERDVEDQH